MANSKYSTLLINKPHQSFDYFYYIILILILSTLIWQNVIQDNVFININNISKQIQTQNKINKDMAVENNKLSLEFHAIKNNKMEILESKARNKLGMIKKGEKFYQLNNE